MPCAVSTPPNGCELCCQLSTPCVHYVLHRPARCHGQLQRAVMRTPGAQPPFPHRPSPRTSLFPLPRREPPSHLGRRTFSWRSAGEPPNYQSSAAGRASRARRPSTGGHGPLSSAGCLHIDPWPHSQTTSHAGPLTFGLGTARGLSLASPIAGSGIAAGKSRATDQYRHKPLFSQGTVLAASGRITASS